MLGISRESRIFQSGNRAAKLAQCRYEPASQPNLHLIAVYELIDAHFGQLGQAEYKKR